MVSRCYYCGIGTSKDIQQSRYWYNKAYIQSRGAFPRNVPWSIGKHRCWAEDLLDETEEPDPMMNAIFQQEEEITELYNQALEQNNDYAKKTIAICHAFGVGLRKDANEAARWLGLITETTKIKPAV